MTRTPFALTAAAPLAAAALSLPAAAFAQQVEIEANGPVIELSVYESISTEPDLVMVGAGVTSEALTAVEAMRLNAVEMRRVIAAIRELGIADKDIQTTGINLNARYDYDRETQRNVFVGYTVSNRVSVKLRDIDRTGAALDALVVAGATDFSGPSFSIEDDTAAKDAARTSAVARAQARAEAYAALYGYSGVRVLAVSEAMTGQTSAPEMMLRSVAMDSAMSAPVMPGEVSTGVSITVKYEMTGGPGA